MSSRSALLMLVVALAAASCSSDKTVNSGGSNENRTLAGGGRLLGDDPFGGHQDSTGFLPHEPQPSPDLQVFFYSDMNCLGAPVLRVIRDSAEWRGWWDSAWSCLPMIRPAGHPPFSPETALVFLDSIWIPSDSNWWMHDSTWSGPGDSTLPDTVFPCDTCRIPAPDVDFGNHSVVVIALEADSTYGPMLWVDSVTTSGESARVHYTVSRWGEDCLEILMTPMMMFPSATTIAAQVPGPLAESVEWARRDTVWSCLWAPDPKEPVTLYYTDTPCDLGPNEQLITSATAYEHWLAAAMACDSARRWDDLADSGVVIGGPGPGLGVDFSTHAVIVLRAGVQHRWGGGVWLERCETMGNATHIDYLVMEPDTGCPMAEGMPEVNPTAAIRLPLPVSGNITWNRRTETIGCLWGDSVGVVPPDSGR